MKEPPSFLYRERTARTFALCDVKVFRCGLNREHRPAAQNGAPTATKDAAPRAASACFGRTVADGVATGARTRAGLGAVRPS